MSDGFKESAMDTLRSMGYYGEPDDEIYDFKVLEESSHIAKKPHECSNCGGYIMAGTKYERCVAIEEGQFVILKFPSDFNCNKCVKDESYVKF